ncbi:hypothetical protein KAU11_05885 [Candidatus Babeliales bacterium]|nr:hypothetical protein [Candidatus Babeliales bacterium]
MRYLSVFICVTAIFGFSYIVHCKALPTTVQAMIELQNAQVQEDCCSYSELCKGCVFLAIDGDPVWRGQDDNLYCYHVSNKTFMWLPFENAYLKNWRLVFKDDTSQVTQFMRERAAVVLATVLFFPKL